MNILPGQLLWFTGFIAIDGLSFLAVGTTPVDNVRASPQGGYIQVISCYILKVLCLKFVAFSALQDLGAGGLGWATACIVLRILWTILPTKSQGGFPCLAYLNSMVF